MTFKGLVFDADKPKLYSEIRILMAEMSDEHEILFGPVRTSDFDPLQENLSEGEIEEKKAILKKEKDIITKEKNRIQEKVKDIAKTSLRQYSSK